MHTWLCNADPDRSSLESRARVCEGLLEPVHRGKLDISEALGGSGQFVLHDTHICHLAVGEQVGDVPGSRIEGQVPDMRGVRRTSGKGKLLSGISTVALFSKVSITRHALHQGTSGIVPKLGAAGVVPYVRRSVVE